MDSSKVQRRLLKRSYASKIQTFFGYPSKMPWSSIPRVDWAENVKESK